MGLHCAGRTGSRRRRQRRQLRRRRPPPTAARPARGSASACAGHPAQHGDDAEQRRSRASAGRPVHGGHEGVVRRRDQRLPGPAGPLGHPVRAGDRLVGASRARPGQAGRASARSGCGRPPRATEPRTATPSARPTWRIVLLTAEPTPAFSRGSDDMIDSVAGGMTLAMPTPWMKKTRSRTQIGVVAPTKMNADQRRASTSARPVAATALAPNRLHHRARCAARRSAGRRRTAGTAGRSAAGS